ncbi:MAG: MlaD family protein [Bacteroidales bacterium]
MKVTKEAKIGLFAVVCLAVLFWGLNFLKGRNVFSRTNTYYAVFERVDGLKPTNDVMLSGYKIGTVRSINFEDDNSDNLIVALQIEKRYNIPVNSNIKLISSDIMGGKAIRLELSHNKTFHNAGDTLKASIETGLLDQVMFEMAPIKDKAESLMVNMDNALKGLVDILNEENKKNIDQSISSMRSSLENIDELSQSVNNMFGQDTSKFKRMLSNVHSITKNLKDNNQKIDSAIQNFASISDTLARANLSNTLAQTDSAMIALNQIANKINKGEGTLGMMLHNDTLYHNFEDAARNLELLLLDMKLNPKRYINFSLIDFSRNRYEKEKR